MSIILFLFTLHFAAGEGLHYRGSIESVGGHDFYPWRNAESAWREIGLSVGKTADSSFSAGSGWQWRERRQNQLGTAGEDDINTMETLTSKIIILLSFCKI